MTTPSNESAPSPADPRPARILVLGGSFDPIHRGHVRLASLAREELGADRVLLVPAAAQPLKSARKLAPAEDRLAMCRLAAEGLAWLEVSDAELHRPGPSYTYDTLAALRRELGPGPEILFLGGADVLRDLDRWYRIDDLLALATFVVATRPGFEMAVPPRFAGRVRTLEIDAIPVSATEVRARIARGEPIFELLDPRAAEYIGARRLYRAD